MIGYFPSGHYLPHEEKQDITFRVLAKKPCRARLRLECLLPIKDLSNADWLNSISF
jgi:hypothetical protein